MEVAAEAPYPRSTPGPQAPRFGSGAWFSFYLLAPLVLALPLGWYGAGIGSALPFAASMFLWIAVCLISWWLSDSFSRGLAILAGPRADLPILWLILGYCVNLVLSSQYNPAIVAWIVDTGVAQGAIIDQYFDVDRDLRDPDYLLLLFKSGIPGLMVWLVGNLIFELITEIPRFRAASPAASAPKNAGEALQIPLGDSTVRDSQSQGNSRTSHSAQPLRFTQRLTRFADLHAEELLAIEAEDHYIQVHTLRGKELIYYRFRDALEELAPLDGLRIHRSTWVSRAAVTRVEGSGRNLQVVLVSGERLKVSLSHRGAVLDARLKNR